MPRPYTVSEAVRAKNRAAARKPRGRWAGTKEREGIENAKAILRGCLEPGAEFVKKIIEDENSPPELRMQALKFAAERAGLPAMTQSDVQVSAGAGREVWVVP